MLATKKQVVKCMSCLGGAIFFLGQSLSAQTTTNVLTDAFNYNDGALVGQGGWNQTGTSAATPIQVASGAAVVGNAGQDAYEAFTATVAHTDGNQLITNFTVNASAVGTGDYFLHLGTAVATTSGFFNRIFAQTTTGGYFLGVSGSVTTGVAYGTQALTLGTAYNFSSVWTFVPGATNDTISLFYNPTTPTGTPNTLYTTYTFTEAEPTSLAEVNLRQGGGATTAPTVTVDNISINSVVNVPEPGTTTAILAGGGLLLGLSRLRRKSLRA